MFPIIPEPPVDPPRTTFYNPSCPFCGNEYPEFFYTRKDGECIGCDRCVTCIDPDLIDDGVDLT